MVINSFKQTLHSPVDTSKECDVIRILNFKHEDVDVGLNPITFVDVVEGCEWGRAFLSFIGVELKGHGISTTYSDLYHGGQKLHVDEFYNLGGNTSVAIICPLSQIA